MTRHPRRPGRFLVLGLLVVILGVLSLGVWYMVSKVKLPTKRETAIEEPVAADGPAAFHDVTAESGIKFTYQNGEGADRYTILESLGGGVALFDYDGDGRLDVFLTGGGSFHGTPPEILGYSSRLYRNLGEMKFEDVTAAAGLDKPVFYTHGAAAADYDKDGFPDLLVTGWGRVALYHNASDGKGGRRFAEVSTAAGLTDKRWSSSAAWGDLDGDGFPDLYVCYYVDWSFDNDPACPGAGRNIERDVCPPQRFNAIQHRLYRNRGNGTFEDVTATAPLRKDGKGLGAVILDLTGDGKPDIYVANDAGNNFLYRNLGGMKFDEIGMDAGVAVDDNAMYNGSMGVDAADFDGTGRPSLWVTNFQGEFHALYRAREPGRFRHASQATGIGRLGQSFVGFGTAFLDYDLDGWEDLVIANGHVLRHPVGSTMPQRPVMVRNEEHSGRRQFREVPGFGGPYFRDKHIGRGLAAGDLDNDGRPDLVISHQNAPVGLLRNVSAEAVGKGNHWVGFSLAGKGHRDLAGTTLTLEVGDRRMTRFVKGGGSYLSTNDPRALFGLGATDVVGKLTVQWAGGAAETFELPAVNRYWKVAEGSGKLGP